MSQKPCDDTRSPQPGEPVVIPSIAPPAKSFAVPSDHPPGQTMPSNFIPTTGADRPNGYGK